MGPSTVTLNSQRTVVKPKNKNFRFDLGFFFASEKFYLNFSEPFYGFLLILVIFSLTCCFKSESAFLIFYIFVYEQIIVVIYLNA